MYNRGGPVEEACGHCAYWKDIRTDQTRFSAVPGVGFDDPTGAVKVLYRIQIYLNMVLNTVGPSWFLVSCTLMG
jgi:hypothetical protein